MPSSWSASIAPSSRSCEVAQHFAVVLAPVTGNGARHHTGIGRHEAPRRLRDGHRSRGLAPNDFDECTTLGCPVGCSELGHRAHFRRHHRFHADCRLHRFGAVELAHPLGEDGFDLVTMQHTILNACETRVVAQVGPIHGRSDHLEAEIGGQIERHRDMAAVRQRVHRRPVLPALEADQRVLAGQVGCCLVIAHERALGHRHLDGLAAPGPHTHVQRRQNGAQCMQPGVSVGVRHRVVAVGVAASPPGDHFGHAGLGVQHRGKRSPAAAAVAMTPARH